MLICFFYSFSTFDTKECIINRDPVVVNMAEVLILNFEIVPRKPLLFFTR